MAKVLMKGNEAIAEAAIRAGLKAYFGYPITPQNELTAYMAKHMLEKDRIFIQAESEVAAINMVFGAAATGVRTMTSSSSPGISLKQEGISYAAGAKLPMVIVNITRGGPGLGGIAPSQADYFQSTRGGGHGDYHTIVLAPKGVQEAADLTYEAFDLADKYRTPVLIVGDGLIGQMMENVELPPEKDLNSFKKPEWSVGEQYKTHRERIKVTSLDLDPYVLEQMNIDRFKVYDEIKEKELKYEEINVDDADLVFVSYGTTSRVCSAAMRLAEKEGIKLGLIRPITLWPFPYEPIKKAAEKGKKLLVAEMSLGQMLDDVKIAAEGKTEINFYGRTGGVVPTPDEILAAAKKHIKGGK